jgi:hypothetical protein
MHNRDVERRIRDAGGRAGEHVRHYADEAAGHAQHLYDRGRKLGDRFGSRDYSRRLSHAAEDFADEANYHYRRLRRQVSRHPTATVAIVAGTIGAFLLLRHVFRSNDEE